MNKDVLKWLILLFFVLQFIYSQPVIEWEKVYGKYVMDEGRSVKQTDDGGYIIIGNKDDAIDESWLSTGWLLKTDQNGDTVWSKTLGGVDYDVFNSIQITNDDGYIICGYTYSFESNNADVRYIKTDKDGDITWDKTFGGDKNDYGSSVIQTSDGGYFITGCTESYSMDEGDVLLLKTDANGFVEWKKTFTGNLENYGKEIYSTHDGGYIITSDEYGASYSSYNIWIIRMNAVGDTVWTISSKNLFNMVVNSITQTSDNSYIAVGQKVSDDLCCNLLIVKISDTGEILWTKIYSFDEGYCESYDNAYSVIESSDQKYVIAGCALSSYDDKGNDGWIIKTDTNGDSIWSFKYGGYGFDRFYSIDITNDGGYILTGTKENVQSSDADIWLVKLAPEITNISTDSHINPSKLELYQNFPNPFNQSTRISYNLVKDSFVKLVIYNLSGQQVKTLIQSRQSYGYHSVLWDGTDNSGRFVSSGIYVYKMMTNDFTAIQKCILLK